jgi:hypothetical protein
MTFRLTHRHTPASRWPGGFGRHIEESHAGSMGQRGCKTKYGGEYELRSTQGCSSRRRNSKLSINPMDRENTA